MEEAPKLVAQNYIDRHRFAIIRPASLFQDMLEEEGAMETSGKIAASHLAIIEKQYTVATKARQQIIK